MTNLECDFRVQDTQRWKPGPRLGCPIVLGAAHTPPTRVNAIWVQLPSRGFLVPTEALVLTLDEIDGQGTLGVFAINPNDGRPKPSVRFQALGPFDDERGGPFIEGCRGVRGELEPAGHLLLSPGWWLFDVGIETVVQAAPSIELRVRQRGEVPARVRNRADRRAVGASRLPLPRAGFHAVWILGILVGASHGRRFDDGTKPTLTEISRRLGMGPTWARDRVDHARDGMSQLEGLGAIEWVSLLVTHRLYSDADIETAFERFEGYVARREFLGQDPLW